MILSLMKIERRFVLARPCEFNAARTAVFRFALCLFSTLLASAWKCFAYARNLCSMMVFVARSAKGLAIANVVSKQWELSPRFDVVSGYFSNCIASLAGVVVTLKHLVPPSSVPPRVSFLVRVGNTSSLVPAFIAAVFRCPASSLGKRLTALTANQNRLCEVNVRASTRAESTTAFAGERFTTRLAFMASARRASQSVGRSDYKRCLTFNARARSFVGHHMMVPARETVISNNLTTPVMFANIHAFSIAHTLERMKAAGCDCKLAE